MIYLVQIGDTLFAIAQRFGVSIDAILTSNPQITDPNRIFPGQVIGIPSAVIPPPVSGITYIIQQGDTLADIAQRFNVRLNAIITANPQIESPENIFPGQFITIPAGPTPAPIPPPSFTYVIQPGDTLSNLASRFRVNLNQLIAANPAIIDPDRLFPGQIILIPTEIDLPAPVPAGSTYIVQSGDTLLSIAQRFGVDLSDLRAANPQITDPNLIFPGLELTIPPV